MSNTEAQKAMEVLFVMVVPFIVSLSKKHGWSDIYKVIAAVTASLVAGLLSAYVAGSPIDTGDWWSAAKTIFIGSSLFYHSLFKTFGLEQWINPKNEITGVTEQTIDLEENIKLDIIVPETPPYFIKD